MRNIDNCHLRLLQNDPPAEASLAPFSESNNWNVPNCQAWKKADAIDFTTAALCDTGLRNACFVHNVTFQTIYYTYQRLSSPARRATGKSNTTVHEVMKFHLEIWNDLNYEMQPIRGGTHGQGSEASAG
jgi:hypothetical protein